MINRAPGLRGARKRAMAAGLAALLLASAAWAQSFQGYTTKGDQIVDRATGRPVYLMGFGLGGWLLPEGYMWGIRKLDRPWQFEKAIEDLIGPSDAAEFWRRYHDNYVTEQDVRALAAMGVNSLRVPLLASGLMPRAQPDSQHYAFSDAGFRLLDSLVAWCTRSRVGIIWDMHGAPGAQNAENIADSDGEARLWTEPDVYWPRLRALWRRMAERYAGNPYIIGYDLLNEPLLRRYQGIDQGNLRKLYVLLTGDIREADPNGIIFVEGDDWAQNFQALEPVDWDPHLAIAFHSYPPTSNAQGLARWDSLRTRYHVPLWHGETGEVKAPFDRNREATRFLRSANVGWSWWTHKKLASETQPWHCPPTAGFQRILDYWQGKGERPTADQARAWLFDQAEKVNSRLCKFLPDMVASLDGLGPPKIRVILDTDANNELDDQHAIAYLLLSGDVFDVDGITVNATWFGGDVRAQAEEAERVVKLCDRYPQIPVYKGANGSFDAIKDKVDSADFDGAEAVNYIIDEVHRQAPRTVVLLPTGKLTNIALALKKAPSIAKNVRIVWLGSNYPEPGEYNQENDPAALNYILDLDVPFEIALVRYGKPSGTDAVRVTLADIERNMPGLGPRIRQPVVGRHGGEFSTFGDYSVDLFHHIRLEGNPPSRALYDMAAVAIVKNPAWATRAEIPAPILEGRAWRDRPQNPRHIVIWENFQRDAILADFFGTMRHFVSVRPD